jgi:hypothetical protein
MLVPGLPITALAAETVVVGNDGSASSVETRPSFGNGSLRETVRTWQARLLFAACYAFLVSVVAMAG